MYPIIALVIAAVFGFALANSFNFLITFVIAFVASLCLLTFIDTLVKGENAAFSAGITDNGNNDTSVAERRGRRSTRRG